MAKNSNNGGSVPLGSDSTDSPSPKLDTSLLAPMLTESEQKSLLADLESGIAICTKFFADERAKLRAA